MRFSKQCRELTLTADAWLIPCNAFRSQPPLLSNWLEKASQLIWELMHMSVKHLYSVQTSGHCVIVAQEGWGIYQTQGLLWVWLQHHCTPLQCLWLGLGKAPVSRLPGFWAGMKEGLRCAPSGCQSTHSNLSSQRALFFSFPTVGGCTGLLVHHILQHAASPFGPSPL